MGELRGDVRNNFGTLDQFNLVAFWRRRGPPRRVVHAELYFQELNRGPHERPSYELFEAEICIENCEINYLTCHLQDAAARIASPKSEDDRNIFQ